MKQTIERIESLNRDLNLYAWIMGVGFGLLIAAGGILYIDAFASGALAFLGLPALGAGWWAHLGLSRAKREYISELFGNVSREESR